jgi:hypothetical protein
MSDHKDDFSTAFGVMGDTQGPATASNAGASASAGAGAGASMGAGGGACIGGAGSSEPPVPPPLSGTTPPRPAGPLSADDFPAYPAKYKCLYRPTRQFWSVDGVNACFPKRARMKFTTWLARNNRRVDGVTWHPSEPEIIHDKIAVKNGWLPYPGARTFNTYIPPLRCDGNATKASRWVNHWELLYPNDHETIIAWLAHRVQRPGIKPNFCTVLAGDPGIGKDMLLAPIRDAVGPWNCDEIQLHMMSSAFNDYQGGVFLRISEARDSGDGTVRGRIDRYTLNDRGRTRRRT